MNFEGVCCGFPTRETKLGSFEGLLKIPLIPAFDTLYKNFKLF